MKKLLFTTMITMITMNVWATGEKGDMAIGGNLLLGVGQNYSNVGLGAKFSYNLTDPIRVLGEANYFLESSLIQETDFSLYGQYLFPVADRLLVFPSIGVGVLLQKVTIPFFNITDSGSGGVFSLGGGAEYLLTDRLSLIGEFRLKFYGGANRANLVAGVAYKL